MRRTIAGIALAACLAGGAARAADVVEFADGRYLEVQSHSVLGDYIRLEVRPGSFLVFPADRVDEIRRERLLVYRQPAAAKSDAETAPLALGEAEVLPPDPGGPPQARASVAPDSVGG